MGGDAHRSPPRRSFGFFPIAGKETRPRGETLSVDRNHSETWREGKPLPCGMDGETFCGGGRALLWRTFPDFPKSGQAL